MAGVQAGRLNIEIVAEIARLQADLDKAKRAVKAASGDIAKSAKAANDNLSGIGRGAGAGLQQFSRDVARLKSQVDPAWRSLQAYKEQVFLLSQALREGAISQEVYTREIMQAQAAYRAGGQGVVASSNSQRAGLQQLGFQLGDVATMFALGARPAQIFASQIGQVTQAVQLMVGGTSRFATFMMGPWGIALTVATIALSPFIGKLFETEDAADGAADATKRLTEAMANLGNMNFGGSDIDTLMTRATDLGRQASELEARARASGAPRGAGGRFYQQQADALRRERDDLLGQVRTAMDPNNPAVQILQRNRDLRDAKPDKAGREGRGRAGRQGPTAAEIASRFDDQLLSLTLQSLGAMGQLATTVEERAELEMRALEWNQRQLQQQIQSDEHFNAAQKAELANAAERLADYQREIIERRKLQEQAQEAQQIADAQHQGATEALEVQRALADTEQERKALALQIFDAEQAYLRAKLEAVKNSEVVSDTERQLAEIQLQALNATEGQRRQSVSNANMTGVERFMAELDKSPGRFAEARLGIGLDGINQLIDGLSRIPGEVDSVMGAFKAMRDVFQSVIQDMLADLIRLQLQKAIAGLIGSALGGVGGAPANLLAGTPYGGGAATGGPVSAGTAYRIGESGPETFIPRVPGFIAPNGANDNPGTTINVTVSGRMSDKEARRTGMQIGSAAAQAQARARKAGLAG